MQHVGNIAFVNASTFCSSPTLLEELTGQWAWRPAHYMHICVGKFLSTCILFYIVDIQCRPCASISNLTIFWSNALSAILYVASALLILPCMSIAPLLYILYSMLKLRY